MSIGLQGTAGVWRRQDIAGAALIVAFALFSPWSGSVAWDFQEAYRHDTLYHTYGNATWNPYPVYWLIAPFAYLPLTAGLLLWGLAQAAGFIALIRRLRGNLLAFGLSVPCVWIFFTGQIEGFLALGLVLALQARVLWVGVGLTLLTLKPQVGLTAILYVLLQRRDWRILIVPAFVYAASLAYWGWWIPDWLNSVSAFYQRRIQISPLGSYAVFTTLFMLYPLLLDRLSLRSWLAAGALASPYYGAYSLAVLFCTGVPIWANILLWVYIGLSIAEVDFAPLVALMVPLGILLVEFRNRLSLAISLRAS